MPPAVPPTTVADALSPLAAAWLQATFPAGPTPLGAGDVFIAAFIGAAAGLTQLAPALLSGMLLAGGYAAWLMVVRRAAARRRVFAYGAWLCLGAWLALVIWPGG